MHEWQVTLAEASLIQASLVPRLILRGSPKPRMVAGIDCSVESLGPRRPGKRMWAAVVVFDLALSKVVDVAVATGEAVFPYVPGFLAFREGPLVLEAWGRLSTQPDAVICDGQGIAHPRGLGLASHLGLWFGVPTVGCAKSLLVGVVEEPGPQPGDRSRLSLGERVIGCALRTKERCKPVIVSPGHLIGQEAAATLVLDCCRGYRLPEPTRLAHLEVNRLRRSGS